MNKVRDPKLEREDKIRCANFLLQMFAKYGAEVMATESRRNNADEDDLDHIEKNDKVCILGV